MLYAIPGLLPSLMKLLSLTYAKDWRTLYDMLKKDLSRTTMESFSRSISDLRFTDLRPQLPDLKIPAMGIYGRKDNIVSPKQGEVMRECIQNHTIQYFERSGHFPMLDETERFHQTILDFLTGTVNQEQSQGECDFPNRISRIILIVNAGSHRRKWYECGA